MDEWKDRWIAEWLEERKRGREGVWMDGKADRWKEERDNGWMDGKMGDQWMERTKPSHPLTFWRPMENLKAPPASPGPGRSQSSVSKLTSMRL